MLNKEVNFLKKTGYLQTSGYTPFEPDYGQQSSLYEGTKIYVPYVNNVTMNFGNHLRRAVNVLLDVANRKIIFARQLVAAGIINA
jgi:hypothetical protein